MANDDTGSGDAWPGSARPDFSGPGGEDGLDGLRRAIAGCRICRDCPLPGKPPLPHEPRPVAVISSRAKILIAGQAPGLRVHESGLPFNDASGDRLRQWLEVDRATFYDRDRFSIVPMGFCFPGYDAAGSDLPPRAECRITWHDRVVAAMPQVRLVLVIGGYAQAYYLPKNRPKGMTETVRAFRTFLDPVDGPALMPLPHPSWRNTGWLKRHPWFEEDVLPMLRRTVKSVLA